MIRPRPFHPEADGDPRNTTLSPDGPAGRTEIKAPVPVMVNFQSGVRKCRLAKASWTALVYLLVPPAMGLLLFLNPFPFLFSLKEALFYLPGVLFLATLPVHRRGLWLRTPLLSSLAPFSLWVLLGLPFALDPGASLGDFLSHWLRYIVFYFLLVNFFRSPRRLDVLGKTLLFSGVSFTVAIWIGWYVIEGQPLTSRLGLTWLRLATALNGFTTVLTIVLALHYAEHAVTRRWRGWAYAVAAVAFLVSLMSQSRSTLLGLTVAAMIMLAHRRRLLAGGMLVLALFVALMPIRERIFTLGDYYQVRLGHLYYFSELIRDHPAWGTGFALDTMRDPQHVDYEHYMARIPARFQDPPHPYWWPHNILLNVAVRTGPVGALLFSLIFVQAAGIALSILHRGREPALRAWARCLLAALGMFATKALFEPVFTHFCETLLFTILAMITILSSLHRQLPVARHFLYHPWPVLDGRHEGAGPPPPQKKMH